VVRGNYIPIADAHYQISNYSLTYLPLTRLAYGPLYPELRASCLSLPTYNLLVCWAYGLPRFEQLCELHSWYFALDQPRCGHGISRRAILRDVFHLPCPCLHHPLLTPHYLVLRIYWASRGSRLGRQWRVTQNTSIQRGAGGQEGDSITNTPFAYALFTGRLRGRLCWRLNLLRLRRLRHAYRTHTFCLNTALLSSLSWFRVIHRC